MINPITYNTLTIERSTDNGVYLIDNERENEVLLPNRYVPKDAQIGDQITVFVYFDSEDRPVATTEKPKIELGQVRSLKVVDNTRIGAFLDWGLPKDLLVPYKNQLNPMKVDEYHPVTIYLDKVTGRAVGSSKVGYLINNDEISVEPKEEVEIIVAQRRERGFRVIINQKHWGMLYDNQIFSNVNIGDTLKAFVIKISEDQRIDVSLQQQGFDQVRVAVDALREALKENDGVVDCGDKTDSEEIQLKFGMSKKVFKRAAGVLLRAGEIVIEDYKIKKV